MTPAEREALVERMLRTYARSPADTAHEAMRAALSIAEEEIERATRHQTIEECAALVERRAESSVNPEQSALENAAHAIRNLNQD